MTVEQDVHSAEIQRCVYCNANVETKKKVGGNDSVRKRGGFRYLVDLFKEKLSQESFQYTASIPKVRCDLCGLEYAVFCNDTEQCEAVFSRMKLLDYNSSRQQELKTRLSRIQKNGGFMGHVEAITYNFEQKMYNIVCDNYILILSGNEVDTYGKRFKLEDIHERKSMEGE